MKKTLIALIALFSSAAHTADRSWCTEVKQTVQAFVELRQQGVNKTDSNRVKGSLSNAMKEWVDLNTIYSSFTYENEPSKQFYKCMRSN